MWFWARRYWEWRLIYLKLPQFTLTNLNLSWLTSIYLNLSWFTSIYQTKMFRCDPGRGDTGSEDWKRDGTSALGGRYGQARGPGLHVAHPRTSFLELVFRIWSPKSAIFSKWTEASPKLVIHVAHPRTISFLNSRPGVQIKCDIDVTRVKLLSQLTGTHHLVTDPGWENSTVDTYIYV